MLFGMPLSKTCLWMQMSMTVVQLWIQGNWVIIWDTEALSTARLSQLPYAGVGWLTWLCVRSGARGREPAGIPPYSGPMWRAVTFDFVKLRRYSHINHVSPATVISFIHPLLSIGLSTFQLPWTVLSWVSTCVLSFFWGVYLRVEVQKILCLVFWG
jgi:hypothetical protein